jgi:hypothetical protein
LRSRRRRLTNTRKGRGLPTLGAGTITINAPVLVWDGETDDATPDFEAFLDPAEAGDVITLQRSVSDTFSSPTEITYTVTGSEGNVAPFAVGSLADGTYYFRCKHARGASVSAWSNTEEVVILVAAPVVIFGPATLNLNDSGDANLTMRVVIPTSGGGGTEARVTFEASSAAAFNVDNASIGISNGTASQTTAVPVELLFSAASGFASAANAQTTSDWATITIGSGDTVVVTFDISATNGNPAWANAGVVGCNTYYKSGNSYNEANPAGISLLVGNAVFGVVSVEVR